MTDDIEELESRAILKNIQFKDEVYTKKEADDAISAAVKTNSVDLEDYAKKNDLSAYLLSADADRDFTKKTIFDAHVLSANEKINQLESKFDDYALSDDVESNFTKKTIFDAHVLSANEKINQLVFFA